MTSATPAPGGAIRGMLSLMVLLGLFLSISFGGRAAETLLVYPPQDNTPWQSQNNYELREFFSRMLLARLDLAGADVRHPDPHQVLSRIVEGGQWNIEYAPFDPKVASSLCPNAECGLVIGVTIEPEEGGQFAVRAVAHSGSGNNEVIGEWEVVANGGDFNSRAPLLVALADLSHLAAEGLDVHLPRRDELVVESFSDEQLLGFLEEITGGASLGRVFQIERELAHALRNTDSLDTGVLIALGSVYQYLAAIGSSFPDIGTKEVRVRALVLGFLARDLDLQDPRAMYAHAFGVSTYGYAQSIHVPEGEDQLSRYVLQRFLGIPQTGEPTDDVSGGDELIAKAFRNWTWVLYGGRDPSAREGEFADRYAYRGNLHTARRIATLYHSTGELNTTRTVNTIAALQASVLAMEFSRNLLAEAGLEEEAEKVEEHTRGLGIGIPTDSDYLDDWWEDWSSGPAFQHASRSTNWGSNSTAFRAVRHASDALEQTRTLLLAEPQLVRGIGMSDDLRLRLYRDFVADTMLESFGDIAYRLAARSQAVAMMTPMLQAFPDQAAVAAEINRYCTTFNVFPDSSGDVALTLLDRFSHHPALHHSKGAMVRNRDDVDRELLVTLSTRDPHAMIYLYAISNSLMNGGHFPEVASIASRIAEVNPSNMSGHFYRINAAWLSSGVMPDSEVLDKLWKLSYPHHNQYYSQLGRLFLNAWEYEEAERMYRQLFDSGYAVTFAQCNNWADSLRFLGRFDEALMALNDCLDQQPRGLTAVDYMIQMSWYYIKLDDLDASEQWLIAAERIDNWKGSVILRRAFIEFQKGNYAVAKSELERAINRYGPSSSSSWRLLALLDHMGELQETHIQNSWNFVVSDQNMAKTISIHAGRVGGGTRDRIEQKFRESLAESPNSADVLFSAAIFFHTMGNLEEAAELLDRASPLAGQSCMACILDLLARVQIELGMLDEAAVSLEQYRYSTVMRAEWLATRALLHLAHDEVDEAYDSIEPLMLGRSILCNDVIAKVWLRRGAPEQAINTFGEISPRYFEDPIKPIVIGDAFHAMGEMDKARAEWSLALQQAGPDTRVGRMAQQRLDEQAGE